MRMTNDNRRAFCEECCATRLAPFGYGERMTKGDIIPMPSGKPAMYLGGVLGMGAKFAYVDEHGEPLRDPRDKRELDVFFINNMPLLIKLQPEYSHV